MGIVVLDTRLKLCWPARRVQHWHKRYKHAGCVKSINHVSSTPRCPCRPSLQLLTAELASTGIQCTPLRRSAFRSVFGTFGTRKPVETRRPRLLLLVITKAASASHNLKGFKHSLHYFSVLCWLLQCFIPHKQATQLHKRFTNLANRLGWATEYSTYALNTSTPSRQIKWQALNTIALPSRASNGSNPMIYKMT